MHQRPHTKKKWATNFEQINREILTQFQANPYFHSNSKREKKDNRLHVLMGHTLTRAHNKQVLVACLLHFMIVWLFVFHSHYNFATHDFFFANLTRRRIAISPSGFHFHFDFFSIQCLKKSVTNDAITRYKYKQIHTCSMQHAYMHFLNAHFRFAQCVYCVTDAMMIMLMLNVDDHGRNRRPGFFTWVFSADDFAAFTF